MLSKKETEKLDNALKSYFLCNDPDSRSYLMLHPSPAMERLIKRADPKGISQLLKLLEPAANDLDRYIHLAADAGFPDIVILLLFEKRNRFSFEPL